MSDEELDPMDAAPHWRKTPEPIRARLREQVQRGDWVCAINDYQQYHSTSFADAGAMMQLLWQSVDPGPPKPDCPKCGKVLRTAIAQQCFNCGADWHPR
jgi:hypothetical protein